jgi:methyl-accepting chemotaxis protein
MKMSLRTKILMFPVVFFLVILTIGFFTVMTVQDKLGAPRTDYQRVVEDITFKIVFSGIAGLLIVLFLSMFLIFSVDRPIHEVIDGLTGGIEEVSSASGQISQASQHVAQGTSEQASGIEEVSSSLEEIASITKQNSDSAQQAKVVMNEAGQIIKKVQYHMSQMGQAIAEITALSEETSKIIKTIDEIAFQTNLLALNAAVEAARAGEAGAGFSVVANEVRNLAMKASEAAKNTGHLIENTMKAVKKGNELTQSTQDAFRENIEIAVKHTRLIDEIAVASQEQAQGIEQVAAAVVQMNQVTQASAASAEESASAGEELNAQVEQLKGMVQELIAITGNSNGAHNGSVQGAKKARHVVERLHYTTTDLFRHGPKEGQAPVTAQTLIQKQRKPKRAMQGKRTAQKNPEGIIPFHEHEGKEKDEEVLRHF